MKHIDHGLWVLGFQTGSLSMTLRFEVEIIEDVQRIRITRTLLSELSDDICAAVSAHKKVEGNAVNCKGVEVIQPTLRQ
jgi:hypothetical protein